MLGDLMQLFGSWFHSLVVRGTNEKRKMSVEHWWVFSGLEFGFLSDLGLSKMSSDSDVTAVRPLSILYKKQTLCSFLRSARDVHPS